MIVLSFMLFLQRLLQLIIMFGNYFSHTLITPKRLYLSSTAVFVHLLMIYPLKKWPRFFQNAHAPLIILTHSTFIFNDKSVFADDQLITFIGQQMIIFVCVVLLSGSWVYTCLGILATYIITILFFALIVDLYVGVIAPQLFLFQLILSFIAYFCEKKYKFEFLQIKQNQTMKRELENLIESLPESILLYEQSN